MNMVKQSQDIHGGNLELWDAVFTTNPAYTKQTNDGRHSFTAIDAYYRIQTATEKWGPYGTTWKLEYKLQFLESAKLLVMDAVFKFPGGEFQIPNAVKYESNKGNVDDDACKKLFTDTLTKALSYLGFGADVFMGRFDDQKYVDDLNEKFGNPKPQAPAPPPPVSMRPAGTMPPPPPLPQKPQTQSRYQR